jgi:hypothetical protein
LRRAKNHKFSYGLAVSEFLALVKGQHMEKKLIGFQKTITVAATKSARLPPTLALMIP